MINAMGIPACTFKQLWDNVPVPQATNPGENSIKTVETIWSEQFDKHSQCV